MADTAAAAVKFAGRRDFEQVSQHIRSFHVEQAKLGSVILPTRKTIDFHLGLAFDYITGKRSGAVVLDPEGGVAVGGEPPGEHGYDTTLGRVATIWLVWLEPDLRGDEAGRAMAMLRSGHDRLRELGFDGVSMAVRESNRYGRWLCHRFGAKQVERIYHFKLGDAHG